MLKELNVVFIIIIYFLVFLFLFFLQINLLEYFFTSYFVETTALVVEVSSNMILSDLKVPSQTVSDLQIHNQTVSGIQDENLTKAILLIIVVIGVACLYGVYDNHNQLIEMSKDLSRVTKDLSEEIKTLTVLESRLFAVKVDLNRWNFLVSRLS